MRIARTFLRRTAALALLSVIPVTRCSDQTTPPSGPDDPQPATFGQLEFTVEVTGMRPDADGYEITLAPLPEGQAVTRSVEPAGGTFTVPDLALGAYTIRIQGADAHCSLSGSPGAFTIRAGETTKLVVKIFCPGPGAVLVRTISQGRDLSGSGYTVVFEPWLGESSPNVQPLAINDSLTIPEEELPPAPRWTVRLLGVPENCFVPSGDTRTLRPLREKTVTVEFSVTCIARSSLIVFDVGGEILLTAGAGTVNLTNHPARDVGPSLSPDRSRIVFSSDREDPDQLGFHDLYVMNVDGTGLRRLTMGPGSFRVGPQAWSPDGTRIVASMELGESSDIYVVNADGSGVDLLIGDAAWDADPAWSPDGASIAFCSIRNQDDFHPLDRVFHVYRTSAVDGSGTVSLAMGCDPAWSPDGSRIAVSTWDFSFGPILSVISGGGAIVHELRLPQGFAQRGPTNPSWSPDGSQIVFERHVGLSIVGYGGSGFGAVAPFMSGLSPSWR
jgi:hypothetical protein